jgi:hypothetical protein
MRKRNIYALIENDVVVNTIVADYGFIARQTGTWIELDKVRKASPGFVLIDDTFIPPKPNEDFVLDRIEKVWKAPIQRPSDDHQWDTKKKDWVEVKRNNK